MYFIPFMTKVPVICFANQWTGFYMIGTSVMKELRIIFRYSIHKNTDELLALNLPYQADAPFLVLWKLCPLFGLLQTWNFMKVSTKKYKRGSVSSCNYICKIYCFICWMKINTKSLVFSDPAVFCWWYAIDLAFQLWNLYIMVSFLMRKIFHKNLILKRELTWKFWGKATWIISSAMKTKQLFRDAERELLLILEIPLQWWSWSSVNLCFPKFYQLFFRTPRIAAFSVCHTFFFAMMHL